MRVAEQDRSRQHDESPREVVIFRNNLFKVSEPFITQQAQHLERFKPFYLGRLRFGQTPQDTDSLALQDSGGRWNLPAIGWQMLTRNPQPYQRLLGEHRPALVHAHFGVDGVYALPLAQRLKVPLITTFHGFDATMATGYFLCSPAWANYPLFRHRLARQGAVFLCVSSFIRDRVLAMGFPEERTHVHYIGIDLQATRARDPNQETPMILHVGRQVAMKGTVYVIQAFARIAQQVPDVELVIIGDGPLKKRMQALARSLGLGERV
ncbi:MAG: glycosyltransferase, partial [Sinobacteraceae bacterium]|nr:glycosyltransferase [Nevskiaceae bacterium]